ncbi:hypothetical protein [Haloprofundus halobius]|uniref:hypothetical protein n=1 Tax=Haloprofundus halobius TaxID=2876194 RepID=UPI001CCC03ED|nr:hypothetical protein [Haloprofundus halobius]
MTRLNDDEKPPFSGRFLRVEHVDSSPDEFGLQLHAEVVRSEIGPERPPRISISVTNTSSRAQYWATPYQKVFGAIDSIEQDPGLILLGDGFLTFPSDVTLRPTNQNLAVDSKYHSLTLDPNETLQRERNVWDSPENNGEPFQIGTYRFESHYEQYSPGAKADEQPDGRFEWGFSLAVTAETRD